MKKLFLVIDDDSDDREFFQEALSEIDETAQCVHAEDGVDGLHKLRGMDETPDFIFLDLNMPRMDGWQCLTEIKKDDKLKDIPVIIFSTSSSQRDKDSTYSLGASYFLTKPTDYKKLCTAISFIMECDLTALNENSASKLRN